MTKSPEAIERDTVLEQINSSAQRLIPFALCNVNNPYETPLRWHEDRYSRVNEIPAIDLWTKVGARSVYLTLGLDISDETTEILRNEFGHTRDKALWRLCVSEGNIPDTEGPGSMRAVLTVPKVGPVDIDHAQWREDDEGRGMAVFKNDSYLQELGERPEVKGYLLDTLAEAVKLIPEQQLQFIEELVANWRINSGEYLKKHSVRAMGSTATRYKLNELGIAF